ncbi:MAG: ISKra4 family transposase [Desulfobulbaceae bacterium]|nr:ISKra4 family transposase [Desulfobulbaceae bacterium]
MLALKIDNHDDYCIFSKAQDVFLQLIAIMKDNISNCMTLSEIEVLIREKLQDIGRDLTQAKMNMVGALEPETPVKGSDGVIRTRKKLKGRKVETSFGEVEYERLGYGAPGVDSLFPADGHLNLPPEKYTHEVRRLVSEDVTRASYDEALEVLSERTAAKVPKRQGVELTRRAAEDFVDFYDGGAVGADTDVSPEESGSLLIMTTDGKGVVMRTDGLREATKKAAEKKDHKLNKRLSRGEKRDRKRMAQVASVYTISPHVRTAEEIAGVTNAAVEKDSKKSPRPENKRVWASIEREPDQVIEETFKDAQARDPHHKKQWVGLVDGNPKQIQLLKEQATAYGVTLVIILDFIHVLEYLWKASRAFYEEASPKCEQFVTERLLRLLHGQSSQVAKGMRKMATDRGLSQADRKAVDKCAAYLLKYREYLRYDQYLAQGLPIATGVIEGACRYLVKDRMDITGARWGLSGAEAVLRLRSLRASGDFKEYWRYHEKMEQERNHISKYDNGLPPLKDSDAKNARPRGHLRLVKR